MIRLTFAYEREFANGWCCCFVDREGGIRKICFGVGLNGDFVIDGGKDESIH